MAKTPRKSRKKIKETNLDVSFQTGSGPTAQQVTKRVQASNPADALRQAMQGMNSNDAANISIADPNKPGQPLQQGQKPPQQSQNAFQAESVSYPYRIMLPEAYLGLMEDLVDNVAGVKMITVNSRRGIIIESATSFNNVTNRLDQVETKLARTVLEGLTRVTR